MRGFLSTEEHCCHGCAEVALGAQPGVEVVQGELELLALGRGEPGIGEPSSELCDVRGQGPKPARGSPSWQTLS